MGYLRGAILGRHWLRTACLFLIPFVVVLMANVWILQSTHSYVYRDSRALPENDVGLVLGVARATGNGGINLHFKARTEGAALLYRSGKVKHLLLSGDNHVKGYDEPQDMKEAIIAMGVPETAITLDYAGFRTLDSLVRARLVFGLEKLTVVTDEFHAYRAVFLGRHYGMETVAYCSAVVPFQLDPQARIREYGARVKAVLDMYILNTRPRYLGPRINII